MALVTNMERTGLIDRLNDGVLKLSNEVDNNDKKGKITRRNITNESTALDLVELSGEYGGEPYDLIKVSVSTGGAYGVAKFTVSHYENDKLEGGTTQEEIITGSLQHIWGGIYGRWQGTTANTSDYWYIELYSSNVKQTNASSTTIEMVR